MNRMENADINIPTLQLKAYLEADPRSSSEIARLSGVSQPTVSRMRLSNGRRIRRSSPFDKLCIFYGVGGAVSSRCAAGYNELLRDAIADAWDGSEEHGRALLVVIRGLKALHGKTDGNTGDSRDHG
jgi:hypothetical protein